MASEDHMASREPSPAGGVKPSREAEPSAARERPILFSAPMVCALLAGTKTQTRRIVKGVPSWDHYGRDIMDWGLSGIHQGEDDLAGTDRWALDVQTEVDDHSRRIIRCPYGAPADLLWVREAWSPEWSWRDVKPRDIIPCAPVWYWADGEPTERDYTKPKPSIHMPRWASRISLRITDVRVERLQDISEADAIAEGLYKSYPDDQDRDWFCSYTEERGGQLPPAAEWADFEAGVWMAPGVPQGWGLTPDERRRDRWAPTPQFAYRLIWEHIHGDGAWDANPWVWAVSFERANEASPAEPASPESGTTGVWTNQSPTPISKAEVQS